MLSSAYLKPVKFQNPQGVPAAPISGHHQVAGFFLRPEGLKFPKTEKEETFISSSGAFLNNSL